MTFGSDEQPSPNRRGRSAKVIEVRETGFGRFDLRTPPSRGEVGLADGADSAIYESSVEDAIEFEVLLPEGQVLKMQANLAVFSGITSLPSTRPPDAASFSRQQLSSEDARDRLLALAAQFDLEVEPINEWYRIADSQRIPASDGIPNTPFLTTKLGYLSLSVQGRYLPTGDTAVVAVSLFWGGPAFRARTSTPPAPTPS
ncbi:MAG: hypothetical protein ACT4PP_07470 [Sporichthyaceae bacterium]